MKILYKIILFILVCLWVSAAIASGPGFNDTTSLPLTNSSTPNFSNNVGIGSASPGQKIDVQGTVRAIGFAMSGQSPATGSILEATDALGDTTWVSLGWTTTGNNVYETNSGNVGIGTTTVSQAAFAVTNGNVGIGTWAPVKTLTVIGDAYHNGNIGIGTSFVGGAGEAALTVMNGNIGIGTWVPVGKLVVLGGNVGIGSNTPGQVLDVNGTIRSISGGIAFPDGTVQASSALGATGWTLTGTNIYATTGSNNVGIGTTTPQGGFVVTNGNMGIGTWVPAVQLNIVGPANVDNIRISDIQYSDSVGFGYNSSGSTYRGASLFFNGNKAMTIWSSGEVSIGANYANNDTNGTNTNGLIVQGNVGMGTYNPLASLQVNAALNPFLVTSTANVGVGTSFVNLAALTVMNGNVGIGTWVPAKTFSVIGDSYYKGNIGIGTTFIGSAGEGAVSVMNGNVGIGTWLPGGTFSVQTAATHAGSLTCWTTNGAIGYCSAAFSNAGAGSCTCTAL